MLQKLFILILLQFLPCFADLYGKVIGISDGDTYTILTEDKKSVKVRLHGVDCPEKNQPFGTKAKQFASSIAYGKNVKVTIVDTDRYGRTVGILTTDDGTNINNQLVADGYAWWYKQYAPQSTDLKNLQQIAQSQRKGLWADPNPVAPWVFRREARFQKHQPVNDGSSSGADKNDAIVIFNTVSLKYHCSQCRWAQKCTNNCVKEEMSEVHRKGGIPCKECGGTCDNDR